MAKVRPTITKHVIIASGVSIADLASGRSHNGCWQGQTNRSMRGLSTGDWVGWVGGGGWGGGADDK